MGFSSYRGGFKVGAGFKPDGNSGFPLIESCDIQVDESGQRLDTWIANHADGTGVNLDEEISEQQEIIDDIQEALSIPNVSLAGYQTKADDTLTTDAKDIVGAINELDRKQRSTNTYPSLETESKTLVGAINEVNTKVDNIDISGGSSESAKSISKSITTKSSSTQYVGQYQQIGTITLSSAWEACSFELHFSPTEGDFAHGCLSVFVRVSRTIDVTASKALRWTALNNSKFANIVELRKVEDGVYNLYLKSLDNYETYNIVALMSPDMEKKFSFVSSNWVADTGLPLTGVSTLASATSTADRLTNARAINVTKAVESYPATFDGTSDVNIPIENIKEAHLIWGGKAIKGGISPVDVACSSVHNANRFAFANPNGIIIEYSQDGGNTWNNYETTDNQKRSLVSGIGHKYYIGGRSTGTTVDDKLRITLYATDMSVYTRLRKLLLNISTEYAKGSNVMVERALNGAPTDFITEATYEISGWSGWNSIPFDGLYFGSTASGNTRAIRLTFGIAEVNSAQSSNALQVLDIVAIGDTHWAYPSSMAKTGHLYNYDADQNVTFPAKVTATSFDGLATKATSDADGNKISTHYQRKIAEIDTYSDAVTGLDYDDGGIYWRDAFNFGTNDGGNDEGTIYHKVPIVAGDNVTFEVSDDNESIIINATGGSSGGNIFPLPRIRFANFQNVENEDTGDITFRFTVENMGGGTLQVGDKLQICCKRKYPNNKIKLRKMAEYIITENDLSQRFLKIEVDPSDEKVQKWLFRNDRLSSPTLSAMYFRLKRVTAYDSKGDECNAIFSNVEQVWKTYSTNYSDGEYLLNIK